MFSRKVAAGVIKPETLPPTKGAVAQHGLRCLPADPGLDPSREHISEPQWLLMDIRCTWVWASSNTRLQWPLWVYWRSPAVIVVEIAATGGAAARRMGSCASQPVESEKVLHAKTAVTMLLSLKKVDNDSWSFWHWGWDINNSEYYISMWNKSYFVNVKVSVAFFSNIGCLLCVKHIYANKSTQNNIK